MTGLPIPKGKQKEVVYLPANGHVVVLGTAGSGKTTMALLRAIQLQNDHTNDDDKTLLVTFNRMLVSYIKSFQEFLPVGLDILHYHKVARGYLNYKGKMKRDSILSPQNQERLIQKAVTEIFSEKELQIKLDSSKWFIQEIRWLSNFGIRTLQEYIKIDSENKTPIKLNYRSLFWETYKRYQKLREEEGYLYDWNDIAIAVEDELRLNNDDWIYRHVIIDEGQDFSPAMLKSLVAAIPDNGSLTFFGDVAQQIYGLRVSWQDAGLEPKKIWEFKENYRNTKEIAALALAISEMPHFLGQSDIVIPNVVRAAGPSPVLIRFKDLNTEKDFVLKQAAKFGRSQQVAILVQKRWEANELLKSLRTNHELSVSELTGEDGNWEWKPGVMIGTYQSAKGLEFDLVIMPYCSTQKWPDKTLKEKKKFQELAEKMRLLYVGVTRAKTRLLMTCSGDLTNLLPHERSLYDIRDLA